MNQFRNEIGPFEELYSQDFITGGAMTLEQFKEKIRRKIKQL